ncbi:hypothetical protein B2G71_06780 [Novosphingobium sp. PC22D]|uniref:hypothetical protein n=1 Tax=Novosphingobium sp. PC22D TaxID=1962403 RepID=UPI000BF1655F|nr:hypothetical protein [Novosphingobium sp. PC22D]PEQ13153.1 hypothetical protein B2G71_06780 [Novosphingobium sp. PC22D]
MHRIRLPAALVVLIAVPSLAQEKAPRDPPRPVPAPAPYPIARAVKYPEPVTLEVEVRDGKTLLWSGSLMVGGPRSASFSQSKNEYLPPCPGEEELTSWAAQNGRRTSLRISISPGSRHALPDSFRVSINYDSPSDDCGQRGSNTLGLERVVTLQPRTSDTIRAGSGLMLKLKRRD